MSSYFFPKRPSVHCWHYSASHWGTLLHAQCAITVQSMSSAYRRAKFSGTGSAKQCRKWSALHPWHRYVTSSENFARRKKELMFFTLGCTVGSHWNTNNVTQCTLFLTPCILQSSAVALHRPTGPLCEQVKPFLEMSDLLLSLWNGCKNLSLFHEMSVKNCL